MTDGIANRIREDASISIAQSADEIVYADAVFFKADDNFSINRIVNYDTLRKELNEKMSSANNFMHLRFLDLLIALHWAGNINNQRYFQKF